MPDHLNGNSDLHCSPNSLRVAVKICICGNLRRSKSLFHKAINGGKWRTADLSRKTIGVMFDNPSRFTLRDGPGGFDVPAILCDLRNEKCTKITGTGTTSDENNRE